MESKKISHWLKSVSAFANTEGGALYFGVSNNGTVTGLKDIQADSDFISEKINAHLDPLPEWTLTPAEDENSTPKKLGATAQSILDILSEDPYLKREEIATRAGLKLEGLKYQLAQLQKKGYLLRTEGRKTGRWINRCLFS